MRYAQIFIPTRREDPADAEVISHKLLVRGGFLRMLTRGVYSFLPLGWRVLHKIENIIRQEMNRAGAQEVLLPSVQPAELWQESGRWAFYGPELLRFRDRKGGEFCYGPTHEEVITDLVRGDVRSYKQLPLNLYQIQTKFRDEIRPRAGLMRGREFVMKDAYSFDVSREDAARSYEQMRAAYHRTFNRLGLKFRAVEADTGAIGGSLSHEFQVLAHSGEDWVTSCPACEYAANKELTEVAAPDGLRHAPEPASFAERAAVDTPNKRTVEDVTAFLAVAPTALVKTVIMTTGEGAEPFAVLVRGDHDVNPVKVKNMLRANGVFMADDATVEALTGAPVGFAGPVGLTCPIYADLAVAPMTNFVVGGNARDLHLTGVNHGRDVTVTSFNDLREVEEGDACPRCGATLDFYRGIEVGHIFYLGTKYSEAMKAVFLDEEGKSHPMEMGCYGMGVTRMMAAAIEQNHDADGVVWPVPLAPFEVIILTLGKASDELAAAATALHDGLEAAGIEVLIDDRDERPAVKFKDADLIGIPLRLTLGARGLKEGKVEVKWRSSSEMELIDLDSAIDQVAAMIAARRT